MFKEKQLTIGRTFAYLYTVVQGILALIWMCVNLFSYFPEKLSADYIESAATFVTDDYMGILYSLFLAPIVSIFSDVSSVHAVVAIIQTVAVFVSFVYLINTFAGNRLSRADRIMLSVMASTIPFVLQASFSILPNAFLLCTTLVFAAGLFNLAGAPTPKNAVVLCICSLVAVLLSGDYAFILLILIIPTAVSAIKKRNTTALLSVGSAVVVLIFVYFISGLWTTIESYGRIERTLSVYIYQRCSWPYLFENLNYFNYYFGDSNYSGTSIAITIPEKFFRDYLLTLKNSNPEAYSSQALDLLSVASFKLRTREIVLTSFKDIMANAFPALSTMIYYLGKAPVSVLPNLLSRLLREAPIVSRIYICLFEGGSIVALLTAVVTGGFVKKLREKAGILLYSLLFVFVIAIYDAMFTLRAFDYRNALFAVSVPMIFIVAHLLGKENNR